MARVAQPSLTTVCGNSTSSHGTFWLGLGGRVWPNLVQQHPRKTSSVPVSNSDPNLDLPDNNLGNSSVVTFWEHNLSQSILPVEVERARRKAEKRKSTERTNHQTEVAKQSHKILLDIFGRYAERL